MSEAAFQPRVRRRADAPTSTRMRLLLPQADGPVGLPPLVVLDRPIEPMYLRPGTHRGILARELVRQAVLLAAREELGLVTRDEVLRESVLVNRGYQVEADLELTTVFVPGRSARFTLVRLLGAERQTVWSQEVPLLAVNRLDYLALVERLGPWTRTSLPRALRQAGFPSRPRPAPGNAVPPADVRERLKSLTYLDQFAAVRQLHAALHAQGDSPELLLDLVRAYAHLGVLTEHHWTAAHKVFKARALLYAQRLLEKAPAAPAGRRARAYAAALIGLHQAALADLEQAGGGEAPGWVGLVRAACEFDLEHLDRATRAASPNTLALLLRFQLREHSGAATLSQQAADDLLAAAPECYRVLDSISTTGGLAVLHQATQAGPERLLENTPRRVRALPGLPEAVARATGAVADRNERLSRVLSELERAGEPGRDLGELSWACLGRLLWEDRFLQVFRRADLLHRRLQAPPAAYLDGAYLPVTRHPYSSFLNVFRLRGAELAEALHALYRTIDVAEVEMTQAARLAQMLHDPEVDGPNNPGPAQALRHQDDVYRDLLGTLRATRAAPRLAAARLMLVVSPRAPVPKAVLIDEDWAFAEKHAAAWEKAHARAPAILGALARRYGALKRDEDAARCLRLYIRLSPDAWAYHQLAVYHRSHGRVDLWRATLEEFLTHPETGLEHARFRADIAKHHMLKGEYAQARPYALAAARTGALWAMRCACECEEGLGQWREAERWAERSARRYPEAVDEWVLWCLRTGRGDLKAALRCMIDTPPPADERAHFPRHANAEAYYHLLAREPARALSAFLDLQGRIREASTYGLLIAVLADEVGDKAMRDVTLKTYPSNVPLTPLAALLRQHYGGGAALQEKSVEAALAGASPKARLEGWYVVGRALAQRGRKAEALACFRRCVTARETNGYTRAMARDALRQHGQAGEEKPMQEE
jgi:hypothetical protein